MNDLHVDFVRDLEELDFFVIMFLVRSKFAYVWTFCTRSGEFIKVPQIYSSKYLKCCKLLFSTLKYFKPGFLSIFKRQTSYYPPFFEFVLYTVQYRLPESLSVNPSMYLLQSLLIFRYRSTKSIQVLCTRVIN